MTSRLNFRPASDVRRAMAGVFAFHLRAMKRNIYDFAPFLKKEFPVKDQVRVRTAGGAGFCPSSWLDFWDMDRVYHCCSLYLYNYRGCEVCRG
jgi:hypothetical protein